MNANDVVLTDLEYICGNLKKEFASMQGSQLLIVGGGGFLGYYLTKAVAHYNKKYAQTPINLTVWDNYSRGIPAWLKELGKEKNITLKKHDITKPLKSPKHSDYIIHAASIASPIYYRLHPIETMDANVNGLRILLDYCVKEQTKGNPVKGFLFYSTSEIYGDPSAQNIPTPETYRGNVSCTGPRACYDESKRYGETLCVNFAAQYNLPVKIARPFNNYGPGLKISDRRVIPDFATCIFNGKDIELLSDGSPKRTFCYIADAICGYYKILIKGKNGNSYNIGVETPEISMLQLAQQLTDIAKEHFGYGGKVTYKTSTDKEYLTDNPNRRCPVIEKARKELGYNPSVSLKEGLTRTMLWYKDNQHGEDL